MSDITLFQSFVLGSLQGLERAEPERFAVRREHVEVGRREERGDGVDPAEEEDVVLEAEGAGFLLRGDPLRAVAHHHEHARLLAPHPVEDAHHVNHALHGSEVRDVHQDLLPLAELPPERRLVAAAVVDGRIHEVVDDLHVAALTPERAHGLFLEEL